jgi:hypothetical protein
MEFSDAVVLALAYWLVCGVVIWILSQVVP